MLNAARSTTFLAQRGPPTAEALTQAAAAGLLPLGLDVGLDVGAFSVPVRVLRASRSGASSSLTDAVCALDRLTERLSARSLRRSSSRRAPSRASSCSLQKGERARSFGP